MKQGNKIVIGYVAAFQNQWQDLDNYWVIDLKCSDCATTIK